MLTTFLSRIHHSDFLSRPPPARRTPTPKKIKGITMPPALTIKKEAHPSGTLLDDSILPWFFHKKVPTFRKTQCF
jgi:hypothetical protein